MINYKNKKGFISIEVIIVFAVIILGGMTSINAYTGSGQEATNQTNDKVNDVVTNIKKPTQNNGNGSNNGNDDENKGESSLIGAPLYDSYASDITKEMEKNIQGVNTSDAMKILMDKTNGELPLLSNEEKSLLMLLDEYTEEVLSDIRWKFADVKYSLNNKDNSKILLISTIAKDVASNVNAQLVYYNGGFYASVETTKWKNIKFVQNPITNKMDFDVFNNAKHLDEFLKLSKDEQILLGKTWVKLK